MGIRLKKIQLSAKPISDKLAKKEPETLRACGLYIRKVAKNSMWQKKDINIHSAPGQPPISHRHMYDTPSGKKLNQGLKNTIYSNLDRSGNRRSVVVGGFKFVEKHELKPAPQVQEYGGYVNIKTYGGEAWNRKDFAIGEVQPMRKKYVTRKMTVVREDSHNDPLSGDKICWVVLQRKSQLRHQRRVYRRLRRQYPVYKKVYVEQRPYMRRALRKQIDGGNLQKFFENILNK